MSNTDKIKRLYKVKNNPNVTHLKAEIYYNLGGMNYFTSRTEARGYYMSISPVKRENRGGCVMESYTAFTGLKQLVVPVQRKSKKKMEEAVAYFEEHIKEFMETHFGQFEVEEVEEAE